MKMKRLCLLSFAIGVLFAACNKDTTDRVDALAFKAQSGDKWGLISTDNGEALVPSDTWELQPTTVVNGMFALPDGKGFYQLYNLKQPYSPVTPRRFARIGHFFEEVTLAQETPQSPILIIDRKGNTVSSTGQYPQYDIALAHNFREGRALFATSEGKYGYLDRKGNIVIPPLYDHAYDFHDGVALVGIDNRQGETGYQLINPNGKNILFIQLNNCLLDPHFGNGLLMFKNLNTHQCCYMDKAGISFICLPEEVKESYAFKHEIAVFQTAAGTGVIDPVGCTLIAPRYEDVLIAGKNRTALKHNGYWNIATLTGDPLCDFQYDSIGGYHNRLAVARKQEEYLFINRNGQPADAGRYDRIVEDPTARQEVPQVFIRPDKNGTEPSTEVETPAKDPASVPQPASPKHTDASEEKVPARSVIGVNEWQKTSKKNPFYEEAQKVLSGKLDETDAERRRTILNYMEHLRTSYTTKDIDFLEQLFSENALIIVGTVVRTNPRTENGYLSPSQVIYNVKSKRQYLERLKQVFQANKKIDLTFSNFHIMRHPTQPGIYGVSLRQGYSSDLYSDDGYLFLLWDFRDENAPQIHVRTWQPSLQEDNTQLPEEAIFNIRNFNLQ